MHKLTVFAGLILGSYFLLQMNAGKLRPEEAFSMIALSTREASFQEDVADLEEVEVAVEMNGEVVRREENDEGVGVRNRAFESQVYGAVVVPDLEKAGEIAEFFERLEETQAVRTFVVIGENHSLRGHYEIALSKEGYDTSFGKMEPDLEMIDALVDEDYGVGTSFGAFEDEESINNLIPFIQKSFPDAKIVQVAVKEFSSEENLSKFAEKLSEEVDDQTVVIGSTLLAVEMPNLVNEFHNELSRNVIGTLDEKGAKQMDIDSPVVVSELFKYLKFVGAEKSEGFEGVESAYVFYEGEAISTDRDLTIMAFGDMMLGRYVRTLMDRYGKDYIFENIAGEGNRFFEGADIVFGNLEGPIKGGGLSGGTSMVFGFNEDIAPFLAKYGFNLMSISNNHATDQGWDGVDTTIAALEGSGVGWCGHPSEADPASVHYNKVGDKTYAFLCFQDVTYKLDDSAAIELVKSVRQNVDYLLVSIHWGYEYQHSPDWNTQVVPGRAFVDAGADFVIGHHPHVVQSFEIYNGRPIFYSLGNFVFDQYWSTETQEELAIGIVLDDAGKDEDFSGKIYLYPMKSEMSQSRLMDDAEVSVWIEEFISYGEYSEEMKEQIRGGVVEIGD